MCAIESEPPNIVRLAWRRHVAYAIGLRFVWLARIRERQAAMHRDVDGVILVATPCQGMLRRNADVPTPMRQEAMTDGKTRQTRSLIEPLQLVRLTVPLT